MKNAVQLLENLSTAKQMTADGKIVEIITKLDKSGNVNADLVEVTALISGKNKEIPPPKPLTEVVEAVANRHQEAGYLPSTGNNLPSTAKNASVEFEKSFQKFHLRSRMYPADGECRSATGESFHSKTDDCGWQGRQSDQTGDRLGTGRFSHRDRHLCRDNFSK